VFMHRADPISGYESDFQTFMRKYLKAHPEVIQDQAYGRSIFWDKKVDFAELKIAEQENQALGNRD
jgi:hypothetical protein